MLITLGATIKLTEIRVKTVAEFDANTGIGQAYLTLRYVLSFKKQRNKY